MSSNVFPELDGWDEIRRRPATGDAAGMIDATHRLVVSIANHRSAVSTQIRYLQNKVERLQKSLEQLNHFFLKLNENIKEADKSSTNLATALNKLTSRGVCVAGVGILIVLIQFLFENEIWPFSL
ncbi:MAG TPA: hypothetical protein VJK04_02810 [Candidatus Paceibacterota bacterium]